MAAARRGQRSGPACRDLFSFWHDELDLYLVSGEARLAAASIDRADAADFLLRSVESRTDRRALVYFEHESRERYLFTLAEYSLDRIAARSKNESSETRR